MFEVFSYSISFPPFGVVSLFNFIYSHRCEYSCRYLIVALICVSLMANGAEYFFMSLLAIHISFFCELKYFAHLKSLVICFLVVDL